MKRQFRRGRRAAVLTALLALALVAGAANVSAGDVNISVEVADSPDPVAFGELVGYTIAVANSGPSNATHVSAKLPAPVNESAVAASLDSVFLALGTAAPTAISCPPDEAGVPTCALGTLRGGEAVTLTAAYSAPASGTELTFQPTVHAKDGAVNNNGASHTFTDPAGAETTALQARTNAFNSRFVKPNTATTVTTALTAGPNPPAEPTDPNVSTVDIPAVANGLFARLEELTVGDPTTSCVAGFSCFAQQMETNVGNGFVFSFQQLSWLFRVDESQLPPGVNAKKLKLFHHGKVVPPCSGPAPKGVPPALLDTSACGTPQKFADGDLGYSVSSNSNGDWRFGA